MSLIAFLLIQRWNKNWKLVCMGMVVASWFYAAALIFALSKQIFPSEKEAMMPLLILAELVGLLFISLATTGNRRQTVPFPLKIVPITFILSVSVCTITSREEWTYGLAALELAIVSMLVSRKL